jgi:hypothetical protein
MNPKCYKSAICIDRNSSFSIRSEYSFLWQSSENWDLSRLSFPVLLN